MLISQLDFQLLKEEDYVAILFLVLITIIMPQLSLKLIFFTKPEILGQFMFIKLMIPLGEF